MRDYQRGKVFTFVLLQRFSHSVAAFAAVRQFNQFDLLIAHDGAHHLAVIRMHRGRHKNAFRFRFAIGTHRHQHRFGQRRGTVIERGVGDLHAVQPRNHALELIDNLQRPLARLRLIGGVGAVELTAGHDLPYRCRDVVLIGSRTDKAERLTVRRRTLMHEAANTRFVQCGRDLLQTPGTQLRRDFVEQRFDAVDADGRQHRLDIVFGMGNKRHGYGLSVLRQRWPGRHRHQAARRSRCRLPVSS